MSSYNETMSYGYNKANYKQGVCDFFNASEMREDLERIVRIYKHYPQISIDLTKKNAERTEKNAERTKKNTERTETDNKFFFLKDKKTQKLADLTAKIDILTAEIDILTRDIETIHGAYKSYNNKNNIKKEESATITDFFEFIKDYLKFKKDVCDFFNTSESKMREDLKRIATTYDSYDKIDKSSLDKQTIDNAHTSYREQKQISDITVKYAGIYDFFKFIKDDCELIVEAEAKYVEEADAEDVALELLPGKKLPIAPKIKGGRKSRKQKSKKTKKSRKSRKYKKSRK